MSKRSVAIVGATGYGGAEIYRLLQSHPHTHVSAVTSARQAGQPLSSACPWLATSLVLQQPNLSEIEADIFFLCQETGYAMEHGGELSKRALVIDLSADYRLNDKTVYEEFYQRPHSDPDTVAVYGLPEVVERETIRSAKLIANPGCYPTASLLALMPIAKAGLIASTPIIDAKSGVSGAGRSRKESDYLFSELDNSFKAYGVLKHRHTPEIEQMIGRRVRFTPHLIPAARGIQVTVHVELTKEEELMDLYRDYFADEYFVRIQSEPPSTKQVLGSNSCVIAPFFDQRTGIATICSIIDNLVKGAAGQAIQNMNISLGIAEDTALPASGIWP